MYKIGSDVKFIFCGYTYIGQIIQMNYTAQNCCIYSAGDIFTIPFDEIDEI